MDVSALSSDSALFFCQLQNSALEAGLMKLLLKSLQKGWRCVVILPDDERRAQIDEALWAVPHEWIIPHGDKDAPYPEHQPVYLSSHYHRPNAAEVVFLCDGSWRHDLPLEAGVKRYCLMLENAQPFEYTQSARTLWQDCESTRRQHLKL